MSDRDTNINTLGKQTNEMRWITFRYLNIDHMTDRVFIFRMD